MNEGQKALIKLLRLFDSKIRVKLWDYEEFELEQLKDQGFIETAVADWNWFEINLTVKGREVEID